MLDCFINLEDIKFLTNDDQIISRITALVWRYQVLYMNSDFVYPRGVYCPRIVDDV